MLSARALVSLLVVTSAQVASAQPRATPAPLVGAAEVIKLTTPGGFIDDVVSADGDRLAYVVADSGSKAELHVITLATKQELVVDIAPVTVTPVAIQLVGARAFVVGRTEDGSRVASMIELAGKGKTKPAGSVVYKLQPAADITVVTRDGKRRVAVHRTTATKTGTRHDVELLALETGRRIEAARRIELDTAGSSKQLDFRVNHWSDGWTRAHGIKGGEWDRKENQRAPDMEATYDLVTGKFTKTKVDDLMEQKRRFQTLADAAGTLDFVRVNTDATGVQLWRAGKPVVLELDQPFSNYDAKSLHGVIQPDGSAWIALKVDPVNPAAVARQKADPVYLDVFRASPDGKVTRKARVFASDKRHRFGVIGDGFWLIERNQAIERGGKSLTVYQLQ